MLFYFKLLYVIFPDDRLTATEINELDKNLTKAIPSSCAFLYMNKVAFVGDKDVSIKLVDSMYFDCFGTPFNQTAFDLIHFKNNDVFQKEFNTRPMEWYSAIGNVVVSADETTKSSFTIFHNETMSYGRYVPNFDEETLLKKEPSFIYVPVLTSRGASLNFGDNRLADLQYRTQFALTKIVSNQWNSTLNPYNSLLFSHDITAKTHPFEKPQCDGVGCAMKYIIPQIIVWIYMITLQSLMVSLGLEKERSIKESLLLSGMSQASYFGSWVCSKFVDAIFPALVWTVGSYALQCIQYQLFIPVLLVTFCYGLQMICFALFTQTMFKTSQSMFMACLLFLVAFSLAYYPIRLLGFDKDPSLVNHDALTITFLLPSVSICHFYWELIEAEGMKTMLNYQDPNNYVVTSIWMQLVSCVFWLVLFVYFEQILPQAHGPAHQSHPLFCLGCKKKTTQVNSTTENENDENNKNNIELTAIAGEDDIEKVDRSNYMGISVRNLVKEFTVSAEAAKDGANKQTDTTTKDTKPKPKNQVNDEKEAAKLAETSKSKSKTLRAVNNLNVDFAQGTITAVLGHNGAGKTTSIRCMTGSLMPTSGSVIVNGRDVLSSATDMQWLKKNVGVCPQHDVLYDELSAREHVILFGAMRGLDTSIKAGAANGDIGLVEECLGGVDMLGKADELISTFSGGQKRRLSVALALLGSPPVVILDEPTTGMDVITRQSVWKSIQRLKGKATIILTTHAMEEADALGDRIVVLSHGKVQAQGTSLDLKQRFGVGFHLHVVTQERRKMQVALEDGAEINASDGVSNGVSNGASNGESLGPFDATVLMKLLKSHIDEKEKVKILTDVGTECSLTLPSETSNFPALFLELEKNKNELGINQMALSMTTLEEVFLELGKLENKDDNEKEEDTNSETKTDEEREEEPTPPPQTAKVIEVAAALGGTWKQQVTGVSLLNYYSKKREPMTSTFLVIQPVMMVAIAGIVHLTTRTTGFEADPVVPFETSNPFPPNALAWGSSNMTSTSNIATNLTTQIVGDAVYTFEYASETELISTLTKGTIGQGERDDSTYVEYAIGIDQPWYPSYPPTKITLYTSDTSRNLREMYAATQSAVTLAASTKSASNSINLLSIPTYQQLPKGDTAIVNAAAWSSGGIMILAALPIAFMSAFYGERLVRDRVGGMRVHLFVSSLRRVQYYAGNFLVDFALYLPVAILTPLLLLCFQFPGALKTNLWAFFWLFILFGPVVIGFGYLLSWLFSSVQAAQEWFGELINFTMAIPFLITSFVILDATELGHSLCGIVPGYAVYRGMGVIEGEAKGGQPYLTWSDIFSPNRSLLWVLVVLVIDTIIYWGLIMFVETLEARCGRCKDSCILKMHGKSNAVVIGGGGSNIDGASIRKADPQVMEEVERVKTMTTNGITMKGTPSDAENVEQSNNGDVGLLIANMSKTFIMSDGRLNEAVKDVCLGVQKGTILGLLGMNGAGKTTLLHAIQGKHQSSAGDCYVEDLDGTPLSCKNDVDRVRQLFGICPQHEVLWEYVTPREHLRAFAHIRGVPSNQIEQMVEDLLQRLDLLSKSEEPSSKLSGGMKRRLSIAMSVIGSPKCIFLDEPTTGLDPNTRRFVWDYILEIQEGRIIILTTHSMEEADALCTKIGIMVNGSLLSLGTPQQLKGMHGSGYRMIVRLDENATTTEDETDPLLVLLQEKYNQEGESTMVEYVSTSSTKTTRVFSLSTDDLSLGELFELLENNKEEIGIKDYSVSQTTMEQVFTKFAQFQKEEVVAH